LTATPTNTPTPAATFTPGCGNGVVEAGETCDPPGSPAGANGNLCRADCTVCGDGITQAGEQCDDGNSDECDPLHPQKPVPGDSCNNMCAGLICKDPSKIRITTGQDLFKSHGVIVPMAGEAIDFSGGDVSISLTNTSGTIFTTSLPTGAVGALTNGGFKYKNRDAKLNGGIYQLKARPTSIGTFKLTVISYGDLSQASADMVTHINVAGREWTVRGAWRQTGTGWVFVRAQ
jgi:hypothetical protein